MELIQPVSVLIKEESIFTRPSSIAPRMIRSEWETSEAHRHQLGEATSDSFEAQPVRGCSQSVMAKEEHKVKPRYDTNY